MPPSHRLTPAASICYVHSGGEKRNWKIAASLLVGNWDLWIEEYQRLTVPRRPKGNCGRLSVCYSRLRVSRLTDAKLRTPRRLDVAGDCKGDCTRFIRCRLSVTEVNNMPSFFSSFWCDLVCKEFCRNQKKKKKSLSELSVITYTVRGFTKKKSGKQTGKRKEYLFHPNETSYWMS